MKDQKGQLKELLEKSDLTINDIQWLLSHLENSGDSELKQIMKQQFSIQLKNPAGLTKQASDRLLELIHGKIDTVPAQTTTRLFSIRRIAVAASIVSVIILTTFFLIKNRSKSIARAETNNHQFKNDVPPGGNKATLTLADGSVVVLDSAKNGTLARQGNSEVIKLDGKLLYNSDINNRTEVVYNTISTPKGGQYQLALPDGSLVWLNASSSIHFPTAFTSNERRVEITGEAYFEVAHSFTAGGAKKSFIVSVNGSEIQVLGTHFNVNAYMDEDDLKTTLLEGSVRFVNGIYNTTLHPGQQLQLNKSGDVKLANNVDVDEVVAWKNGLFSFESAGIDKIMRQLSRWYDVEIEYKGRTDDQFIAEMRRDIKLSDVLKALELTGKVKFEIDGKKIVVMP